MADLSTDELTRDGEHGVCETCGELFHWEQLTNTDVGAYCDEHLPRDHHHHDRAGTAVHHSQHCPGNHYLGPICTDNHTDDGEDFGHDSAVDRGLGEGIGR